MNKSFNKVPAVSVTVPVYNTSRYLIQCLNSLQNQSLKDIEFILVDDGSSDESGKICDYYQLRDQRFKVIHQSNGGLAVARQTGLNAANGRYVIVCDSDDWVEPIMYERLYKKAIETDADIVLCGYYAEYEGESLPVQTLFKETEGIIDNEDLLRKGAGSSWIKLVKRDLFERAHAWYEPGINMGEDGLILYKLLKANPKCVQIRGNYYHYRRLLGEETYTNSAKMSNVLQSYYKYNWFKKEYGGTKYYDIRRQLAISIVFSCIRTKDLDRSFFYNFLKEEIRFRYLFTGKFTLKTIIAFMSKIIPLSIIRFLVNALYKKFYK